MDHYFDWRTAFNDGFTVSLTQVIFLMITFTPVLLFVLQKTKRVPAKQLRELWLRWATWLGLVALIFGALLLGRLATVIGLSLLSLFCMREYARVTGLIKERSLCVTMILGIFFTAFAAIDHWQDMFFSLPVLACVVISIVGILKDEPHGYIRRVALAVFGFIFFGFTFLYLALMVNDPNYRSYILLVIVTVSLNDIFAYICGNLFGRSKLIPKTSPNKTVAGAIGALILTATLVAYLGQYVFSQTALDNFLLALGVGVLISLAGIFGDLLMSSIKRDVGVKDTGQLLPGHGGLLDRFDSLVLVAPAFYHCLHYFINITEGMPQRIISAGGF